MRVFLAAKYGHFVLFQYQQRSYMYRLISILSVVSVMIFMIGCDSAPAPTADANEDSKVSQAQKSGKAKKPLKLNVGKHVNASQCDAKGAPVINIKREVKNSIDSGFGTGTWWAQVDYLQHVQAWETGEDTYCVISRFEMQFDAFEGQGTPGQPGDKREDGMLEGDESGTSQGGYHAEITGDLKDNPDWKTNGFVGTQDYNCDKSGTASCDGSVDLFGQYFNNYNLSYEWWGWIYHGGKHGTWVNSIDFNAGDID